MWADNLFKGIDVGPVEDDDAKTTTEDHRILVSAADGSKSKDDIVIQVDGGEFCLAFIRYNARILLKSALKLLSGTMHHVGFQNTFIFAERHPITTAIWRRS